MVNRVVDFENGHTWMDIQPGLQSVYLQPGEKMELGCARLYTDGASGGCVSPLYQPADATVATVDSTGLITALRTGFTRVTINDGTKNSTAQVWVVANPRLPHFGGGGELLNAYQSKESLFVIAPFFLDPDQLAQDSKLQQEVADSGVNTLGFGVYLNPRNTTTAYLAWQTSFDTSILPKMNWARDNGYHLLLTGDDIFRQIGTDAWYTLNWPSARQAVQYAASRLAGTGVGIGIEGIDEASMI
jgi:hypothetical protein